MAAVRFIVTKAEEEEPFSEGRVVGGRDYGAVPPSLDPGNINVSTRGETAEFDDLSVFSVTFFPAVLLVCLPRSVTVHASLLCLVGDGACRVWTAD